MNNKKPKNYALSQARVNPSTFRHRCESIGGGN